MARAKASDGTEYDLAPGYFRFNVLFKSGCLDTRVSAAHLKGKKVQEIERIWIVQAARRATADEVKKLCAGTWKG